MKMTVKTEVWEVKETEMGETPLTAPQIVFDIMKKDFDCFQENFHVLGLSTTNMVLQKFHVAKGNHNTLYINPADVFRPLLISGCSKFIVCHNHPSGQITPSEEDLTMTRKIKKGAELLGLRLLDHIIYTSEKWYSFSGDGLL